MLPPMEWIQNLLFMGAVAMFFVVAGINLKMEINAKDALNAKAMRLLIPYCIYSLLLFIIEHDFTRNGLTQFIGILYARMPLYRAANDGNIMFMKIGNAPLWFLPCMFLVYVWIYGIFQPIKSNKGRVIMVIFFLLLSLALSYCPVLLPWSLDTSFMFSVLLLSGYKWRNEIKNIDMRICLLTLVLWVILFTIHGNSNISIGEYGRYGFISYFVFILAVLCETYSLSGILQSIEKTWLVKVLAYVGRSSLRLMCIHLIIYIKYQGFVTHYIPSLSNNRYAFLLGALFVILFVNAIADYLLKRASKYCALARYL